MTAADTAPSKPPRIVVVDVLRAIALFGIIITHAVDGFLAGPEPMKNFMVFGAFDAFALQAEKILTFGKFYTLFSFLFGLSFAIQMRNATEKGRNFGGRFSWRLLVLLLIALAHSAFFSGDVLIVYAILGLLLVLFRNRSTKALVITALILVLNVPGIMLSGVIAHFAQQPEIQAQQADGEAQQKISAEKQYAITKSDDGGALVGINLSTGLVAKLGFMVVSGRLWVTFGLFLLGLVAGRMGLFQDTPEHREFFRKLLVRAAPVAAITTLVMILKPVGFVPLNYPELGAWVATSLQQVSLSAVYLAGFTLLYWRGSGGFLGALAPAGRMGLTTYVMQSVFGLVVFYGLGFGLLGEIGVAAAIGLAMLFFVAQVFIARAWLAHFSMGPLEWLWRALTYFSLRPNRQ
jgi:uncharacterized protein